MKIRTVLGPALAALVLVPACAGSSASGGASGSAGAGTAGAPAYVAGASNSGAGAPSSAAGAPAGGAPNEGGAGAPVNVAGASPAGGAPAGGSGGAAMGMGGASGGSSGGATGSAGAPVIPDTKVVMYLPNWAGSFSSWATKVDFKKMTHLLLAFGTSKGNDWNLAPDADVLALTKAAHAANVKVLVSIGGADDDIGICNQYHTASNIDPMVMNLDAMVTRDGLDGVDVDIERGNEMKTSGNFPQFLTKLQTTLHGHGKLVTAATAQYIVEASGTDAGVLAYLKSYDFINLMIYDSNMNTYTSELNWWTSKTGVAKNHLVWGVIFSNATSASYAKQLTTASKAYGGVMVWEYSQGTEPTLWPAIQSAL